LKVPLNYSPNAHSNRRGKAASYASYIHVPTAVTIPSATERHTAWDTLEYTPQDTWQRTSERCECSQGVSPSLLYRVQTRNTSSSFRLRSLMSHPQPPASVTHTWNRQGHTVMLQIRGEALAAGLAGEKPACKSHTCWIRFTRFI